ncbi:MAG: STAS domain-containing protein [Pseudonocardia sp.]
MNTGVSTNGRGDGLPGFDVVVEEPVPWMLLVRVRGALDATTVLKLREIVDGRLTWSRPCRLVIELSDVTLLSSAGLDFLRHLHRRSRAEDVHLMLVGAGNRAVHRPLRLTGLLALFDTRPTVAHALVGSAACPAWHRTDATAATALDETRGV